jgi:hypothetical protein
MNTALSEPSPAQASINPMAPSLGLQQERLARIATRRAFVEMKQSYMNAASDIASVTGDLLQYKVRKASEPWELWSLRAVILASLTADHERTVGHRMKLEREFDSIFSRSRQ